MFYSHNPPEKKLFGIFSLFSFFTGLLFWFYSFYDKVPLLDTVRIKETAHFCDYFQGFYSDFSDAKFSRDRQKWAWHFDTNILTRTNFIVNFTLNLSR